MKKILTSLFYISIALLSQNAIAQNSAKDKVLSIEYVGGQDHPVPPIIIGESIEGVNEFKKYYAQIGARLAIDILIQKNAYIVDYSTMQKILIVFNLNYKKDKEKLRPDSFFLMNLYSKQEKKYFFLNSNSSAKIVKRLHEICKGNPKLDSEVGRFARNASEFTGKKLE